MSLIEPDAKEDVPELTIDRQSILNFMSQYEPFLSSVTDVLSKHLDRQFEGSHEYVPATLLFNPFVADHVFWIGSSKEYGSRKADDALLRLKRFDRWLSNGRFEKMKKKKRKQIFDAVLLLSGPLYYLVLEAVRSADPAQIRSAINFLIKHQEQCLVAQAGQGGKYRAFRTAVALRAIFEVYSDVPITDGEKYGAPSGVFCKCLEELFNIGRIEGGFRHYARKAKGCQADDPLLTSFKNELRAAPARVTAHENR
ncbi:MAG: hypothetical protein AAFQ04_03140 [Pseudomonadota bacterium]